MASVLANIAVSIVTLGTALPLSKRPEWWIRGWDFPRVQLLAIAAGIIFYELVLGQPSDTGSQIRIGISAVCLLYHAIWIFPYTRLSRREVLQASGASEGDSIRILAFNVLTPNRKAPALLAAVEREKPDVVITLETDKWWEDQLAPLHKRFPHVVSCPLDNLYGIHLFSRLALEDCRIQFLVEPDKPSIHTLLVLPSGNRIELHCLHPAPPSPTENDTSSERDAELVMVGKAVKDSPYPVIVTGDLNDVAWSKTTRLFRKMSGLLDPRIGRGFYNTFHAKYPFFRWPVDHIFSSRHLTLRELKRLENCGSDHFPVLIDLAIDQQAAPVQADAGLEKEPDDEEEAQEKTKAEGVSPNQVHRPGRGRAKHDRPLQETPRSTK